MDIPSTNPMFSVALIVGIIAVALVIVAFDQFRKRKKLSTREHRVVLNENDDSITHIQPGKEDQSLTMSSLERVSMESSASTPEESTLIILLESHADGAPGQLLIPEDADGVSSLWKRLFRLPEFDHAAYALAKDSEVSQRYILWQRRLD